MQQLLLGLGAGPVEYTASNSTNINLLTVFGNDDWTADKEKIYIIDVI